MRSILLAGGLALLITLVGTRFTIAVMVRRGYGQFIRDDGPTAHHTKRGTPTMGGIIIILAVIAAYGLSHLITWTAPTVSGLLVLYLFAGLGIVGFLDDSIKISKARSLGLNSTAKLIGQTLIAASFALAAFQFPNERGLTPASTYVSFLRDISWLNLPLWLAVPWLVLLVAAWSNAANITDGQDGLATGASTMIFAAYAVVNIWQYKQSCASLSTAGPQCYEVRDPYDLAVISLALAGACFGFLWWNASPAKIFMGDTGSLAIGGALAALSIFTRTEFLMGIVAGLFVLVILSVVLQVSFFKLTGGRRLFKMAPLHHHFQLLGWEEITITIRFWIICGLCVALGLGVFYAEWLVGQ